MQTPDLIDVVNRRRAELKARTEAPKYRVHWQCDCNHIALCMTWGPMRVTKALEEVTCLKCLGRLRREAMKSE